MAIADLIRSAAREALANKSVDRIIAWKKGDFAHERVIEIFTKPEEIDELVYDEFCVSNVSKLLIDECKKEGKVGVFLKACDSYGMNQIIKDNRLNKEKVLAFGISCEGMIDYKTKALYAKCQTCDKLIPVSCDKLLGETVRTVPEDNDKFSEVAAIEKMTPAERKAFWQSHFDKCLHCYACIKICPACNCEKCYFSNKNTPNAIRAHSEMTDDNMYHLTRAYHVAGRCVDCGECDRSCPANIPLRLLNRKIIKELGELYGENIGGKDTETDPPLVHYELDDIEPLVARDGKGARIGG